MGAFFDEIPSDSIKDWIRAQKLFFVATAALSASHHVNTSPKGHDVFHLVSSKACWYLDLTGSGNETLSHLREPGNGRITIMFCGFEGPPRIVRLFGTGKVFELDTPEFNKVLPPGDPGRLPGTRSIIYIDIHQVGTSCGYSVPFFDYKEDRPTLLNWAAARETADLSGPAERGLKAYWKEKNAASMDGLPGLRRASVANKGKQGARGTLEGFWGGVAVGVVVAGVLLSLFLTQDLVKKIADVLSI